VTETHTGCCEFEDRSVIRISRGNKEGHSGFPDTWCDQLLAGIQYVPIVFFSHRRENDDDDLHPRAQQWRPWCAGPVGSTARRVGFMLGRMG
jgi:hypothetical protein